MSETINEHESDAGGESVSNRLLGCRSSEKRGAEMATKKGVYEELKRQMPKVVDNLEATVNMGIPHEQIFSKIKEFTPVELPDHVWEAISMALDYLILKRDLAKSVN